MRFPCKELLTVLFIITCLSGFLFQLQQVSYSYFRYQTISRLEVNVKDTEAYSEIYFCARYAELLDRRNYKKYNLQPVAPIELADVVNEMSNLTMRNILELTPSINEVISRCVIRTNDFSIPELHPSESCNFLINVSKSVNGEHICYAFVINGKQQYSMSAVAASMNYISHVYEIELSEKLSSVMAVNFIMRMVNAVSPQTKHPLHSRLFAARVLNLRTMKYSKVLLYPETTKIHRLPPPFDTHCSNDIHSHWCYEQCLVTYFKEIHRVPWSSFIDEQVDLVMLTIRDLQNSTISNFTEGSFQKCHQMCRSKTDCESEFTKTTAVEAFDAIHNLTRVAAMVPSEGAVDITSVQLMPFIDFMVQVGSCFGTWFGLSVFSISPLKVGWKQIFTRDTKPANPKTGRQLSNSSTPPKCRCDLCFRRSSFHCVNGKQLAARRVNI